MARGMPTCTLSAAGPGAPAARASMILSRQRDTGAQTQPERVAVEGGHGAGDADVHAVSGGPGRTSRQVFNDPFPAGEQVIDHRLASGGGRLAELVRALVAPVAL